MNFLSDIFLFVKNIIFIEFFKKVFFGGFFRKITTFVVAVTLFPMIMYILEVDEKPLWTQNKIHYVADTLTVNVAKNIITTKSKTTKELRYKAIDAIKDEIYKKALKQIKISYEWDTFDEKLKSDVISLLKDEIKNLNVKDIKQQDIFEESSKVYVLYSLENEYIITYLQDIYEKINDKILIVKP